MIDRQSSGSVRSARSIEPITSANSTVTCLRSPSRLALASRIFSARYAGVRVRGSCSLAGPEPTRVPSPSPAEEPAPLSARPPALQNFLPAGFTAPHSGQSTIAASDAPQAPQKSEPSGFSSPHVGQTISLKELTLIGAAPDIGGGVPI